MYFLGFRGLTSSSYIPLVDIQTYSVYSIHIYVYITNIYIYICMTISIQYTYISIQYIYLFLMKWNCKRLTSIVFVTVDSDRTVVVLLHKQTVPLLDCWNLILSNHLELSVIISTLSQIVRTLQWASLTLRHISAIHSLFWVGLLRIICLLPIFHLDCTRWCWSVLHSHC